MTESNTILRYLADTRGRHDLYPRDQPARARVDEALDRLSLHLRPALLAVERAALGLVPLQGFDAKPRDPAGAVAAAAEQADTFATFNALVPESGYLLGELTLVDLAAAPVLDRTHRTEMDLDPYPGLRRWRDTVCARPAFARAEPVI